MANQIQALLNSSRALVGWGGVLILTALSEIQNTLREFYLPEVSRSSSSEMAQAPEETEVHSTVCPQHIPKYLKKQQMCPRPL